MTQRRTGMTVARYQVLARLNELDDKGSATLREAQCSPKLAIAMRELGWVELKIERRAKPASAALASFADPYPLPVIWPTIVGVSITKQGREALQEASF